MKGVQYTSAQRGHALRLAEKIGMRAASAETGVSLSALYAWRCSDRIYNSPRGYDETKGGQKNTPVRLNDDLRRRVVQLCNAWRSQKQIAELLGLSQAEISRIICAARLTTTDNDNAVQVGDADPETSNKASIDDLRQSIDDLKTAVEIAVETLLEISEKNNESKNKNSENVSRN